MKLTKDIVKDIEQNVANNISLATSMLHFNDLSFAKMLSGDGKEILHNSHSTFRRFNDIVAGCYAHTMAIDHNKGDDCVDHYGYSLELKFAILSSKELIINSTGSVSRPNGTGLTSNTAARFKVYEGTDTSHHNKDTAFVLFSGDHCQFITGFILPGDKVQELLHTDGRGAVDRTIPLSQFIAHGFEFSSSVKHMGWDLYYEKLWYYIAAKDGLLDSVESMKALHEWAALADDRNLKSL